MVYTISPETIWPVLSPSTGCPPCRLEKHRGTRYRVVLDFSQPALQRPFQKVILEVQNAQKRVEKMILLDGSDAARYAVGGKLDVDVTIPSEFLPQRARVVLLGAGGKEWPAELTIVDLS